jgi:AraC-like DNA-binding protein
LHNIEPSVYPGQPTIPSRQIDRAHARRLKVGGSWVVPEHDDALMLAEPVMGMMLDDFNRLLSATLAAGRANRADDVGTGPRTNRYLRGVRRSLDPSEGQGHSDFFQLSETLCVSITDAVYAEDTWIGIAGSRFMKVRLLLSGRLLTASRDVLSETSEATLDISPLRCDTGFYIAGGERVCIVCLHYKPEYLTEAMGLDPTDLPSPINKLFSPDEVSERLKFNPDPKVLEAGRLIAETRRHISPSLRAPYLEALCTQILVHTIGEFTKRDSAMPHSLPMRPRDLCKIREAREYLNQHFANPPKIRDLARYIGVNQTKLKAGFRRDNGVSIYEYVLKTKMERAAYLLQSGDYDVAEVAFAVGYSYAANFTHAFKKFHGTLPHTLAFERRARSSLDI